MQFCPSCGSKTRSKSIAGRERSVCSSCEFVNWGNPAPVAAAVLIDRGKVILVRPNYLPIGRWGLPAGYVEAGESAEEAILREIKEETNLDARLAGIIRTYSISRDGKNLLYIAFHATAEGGELVEGEEIAQVGSFPLEEAQNVLKDTTAGRALADWVKSSRTSLA